MSQGVKRLFLVFVVFIIQVVLSLLTIIYFANISLKIEILLRILGLIFVLIDLKSSKSTTKIIDNIFWIVLVIIIPILGVFSFVFVSNNFLRSKTVKMIRDNSEKQNKYLVQDENVLEEIEKLDDSVYSQFNYINKSGYPVYNNDKIDYFKNGESAFIKLKEDLLSAKKYIFMEYFIVNLGKMWNEILEILVKKVNEGVEVKVIYDDVGSINGLPDNYDKELENLGIKCISFNVVNHFFSAFLNNRDHRKITVIDGIICYTGGINIGDEYINYKERFGYWKDSVVRIEGEVTWNFTVAFLSMWKSIRKLSKPVLSYKPKYGKTNNDGYVSLYCSNPLKKESVGENVYLNMINQSKKSIYILTPYLIIDNNLIKAFILAKKRGVDIKIVTPGVPDKKIVYDVTRSYYKNLLENGIEIYEYSSGFLHSKVFLVDDKISTVGTINLDYRSLDMHFECSSFIYKSKVIKDIKNDIDTILSVSRKITIENTKTNFIKRLYLGFLRIFSTMM